MPEAAECSVHIGGRAGRVLVLALVRVQRLLPPVQLLVPGLLRNQGRSSIIRRVSEGNLCKSRQACIYWTTAALQYFDRAHNMAGRNVELGIARLLFYSEELLPLESKQAIDIKGGVLVSLLNRYYLPEQGVAGAHTLSSMCRSFWATARIPMAASGWRSWLLMEMSDSTAVSGVCANSTSL